LNLCDLLPDVACPAPLYRESINLFKSGEGVTSAALRLRDTSRRKPLPGIMANEKGDADNGCQYGRLRIEYS
jgi:hypothetical protein